jgi:3-oxoacyl-[acyl-carrier-protein] synthase-3
MHGIFLGVGGYLPSRIVKNDELAQTIETSDEWIRTRTGICQRHILADDQTTSSMAIEAGRRALEDAGIEASAVDLVIVATTTPDKTFPSTAVLVQEALGTKGAAFDVQAVCSGLVYGLHLADQMIKSGSVRHVLVIGADAMSRILDWKDRNSCVLFGDGAGAILVGATDNFDKGIISSSIHSDGALAEILATDGGTSSTGTAGVVTMQGKEVFKHAVHNMSSVVLSLLDSSSLKMDDVDWVIPHQANMRIMDAVGKKLSIPATRVIATVDKHANTSAASIGLALWEAKKDGRLQSGQLLALTALGAGLTWGGMLVRF